MKIEIRRIRKGKMVENPYFELFEGKKVLLSKIKIENPMIEHTVIKMILIGGAVGQWNFEGDLLVFIPNRQRLVKSIYE